MYGVTFDASVIWGLIGHSRLFDGGGLYRNLVWFFLAGAPPTLPVWATSRVFLEKTRIPLVSWLVADAFFSLFVFRYQNGWRLRCDYVLSAALNSGTAFMGVLLLFTQQNDGRSLRWLETKLGHFSLATCTRPPTSEWGIPRGLGFWSPWAGETRQKTPDFRSWRRVLLPARFGPGSKKREK